MSVSAELEELELQRGGAPAPAGQRLLLAGPSEAGEPPGTDAELYVVRGGGGRCEAGNALRWFTSAVVYAAFLGLVRAGATGGVRDLRGPRPGVTAARGLLSSGQARRARLLDQGPRTSEGPIPGGGGGLSPRHHLAPTWLSDLPPSLNSY